MTATGSQRIDEYANSMFRYEYLPEKWIASCTSYLTALFGQSLRGKTVIDYGFGRGNWSLAFRAAGASKVIAIDASPSAVARFTDHCKSRDIEDIEVVQGNVLQGDVTATGDLVWLYGVLNHIEDQAAFLARLVALAAGPAAQVYVYHHNARSLREFTVQTCRSVLTYESERTFREDSALFVRPARMRARDDLTAPHLKFSTACELRDLLRSCGMYITRQDRDFQQFLLGTAPEDFRPHQFLCRLRPEDEVEIAEPAVPYFEEIEVLGEIARDVLALPLSRSQRKKLAIGLFNTHFAFMRDGVHARESVIEICLFLLYVLLENEADERDLGACSAPYYAAFRAALAGADRSERLSRLSGHDNELTEHLAVSDLRA